MTEAPTLHVAPREVRASVRFAWLLVLAGAVGFAGSFVLVIEKFKLLADPTYTTSCDVNPWISCGQVMQRWQSEVFGFPNPLIGVVGFTVMITTGLVLLAGGMLVRWYWLGLQLGVTVGSAFAIWLWSQALFDIHILCLYCMVVWAAMIPLFVAVTVHNVKARVLPVPDRVAGIVVEWSGAVMALIYVVVAGSVVLTFLPAAL